RWTGSACHPASSSSGCRSRRRRRTASTSTSPRTPRRTARPRSPGWRRWAPPGSTSARARTRPGPCSPTPRATSSACCRPATCSAPFTGGCHDVHMSVDQAAPAASDVEDGAGGPGGELQQPHLPEDRFADRELSWLRFNERVLELAEDPDIPLLERVRYLRSEEHTSELQSRDNLVCRLLLEKKNDPRRACDPRSSRLLVGSPSRRPPASRLLPYTTLFRSRGRRPGRGAAAAAPARGPLRRPRAVVAAVQRARARARRGPRHPAAGAGPLPQIGRAHV